MDLAAKVRERKKDRKITCCKHSLKCKHKSKWRDKWAECGNCTSIPVLDTDPVSDDDDDEALRDAAKREILREFAMRNNDKTSQNKMPRKLTKAEILKKFSTGELPAKEVLKHFSKGEILKELSQSEALRKFSKGETLRKLSKMDKQKKLSTGEILKKLSTGELLPKFALFPAVQPCGCNRDEINTNDISAYNTKQVSRSLCELPSDESYMSCRNCSPVSSDTAGSATSEDSESCTFSVQVESENSLMQDTVYNGSLFDSKHELSDPMEEVAFKSSNFGSNTRVGRVASPIGRMKTVTNLGFNRCEN